MDRGAATAGGGDGAGVVLFYAQHNFPGARYQEGGGWDYAAAALAGSSYIPMNPVLCWLTGNIGYHHVHHLNARIPFYRLPEAMARVEELRSPRVTTLTPRGVYRCLRLKLWDPDRQCLVGFAGRRRASEQGRPLRAWAETREGVG